MLLYQQQPPKYLPSSRYTSEKLCANTWRKEWIPFRVLLQPHGDVGIPRWRGRWPYPSSELSSTVDGRNLTIGPSTTYDGEQPCKSRVYPCFMLIDFFSWCGSKMPFAPHSWVRSQVKRFNINKPETKKTSRQIRKFESSEGVFCDDFNPKKPLKEHSSSSVN